MIGCATALLHPPVRRKKGSSSSALNEGTRNVEATCSMEPQQGVPPARRYTLRSLFARPTAAAAAAGAGSRSAAPAAASASPSASASPPANSTRARTRTASQRAAASGELAAPARETVTYTAEQVAEAEREVAAARAGLEAARARTEEARREVRAAEQDVRDALCRQEAAETEADRAAAESRRAAVAAAETAALECAAALSIAEDKLAGVRRAQLLEPVASASGILRRGFPEGARALEQASPGSSQPHDVEFRFVPFEVRAWDDFDPEQLIRAVGSARVPGLVSAAADDDDDAQMFIMDSEKMLQMPIRQRQKVVRSVLKHVFPSAGFDATRVGTNLDNAKGGITDDYMIRAGNVLAIIGEWKSPFVPFDTSRHVADVYSTYDPDDIKAQETASANVTLTLIQLCSYLMLKQGGTRYGYFTNYEWWAFVRRDVDRGQEVAYVSRWFKREDAGLAWAYLMWLVVACVPAGELALPKGATKRDLAATSRSDRVDEDAPAPFAAHARRRLTFTPYTTETVLGIEAFSTLPSVVELANTEKSCVLRATVAGRDLVARQVDMHNLPHHSDYSTAELETMMNREHAAYARLRHVWGVCVPELINIGPDFGPLWATITTYEGESLEALAGSGRLDPGTIRRAKESLRAVHDAGVLHGDVALRNAVRRERDGAVLWVDLEFAEVLGEGEHQRDGDDALARRAAKEMALLDAEFDRVQREHRSTSSSRSRTSPPAPAPRGSARVCPSSSPSGMVADCTKRARASVVELGRTCSGA